MKMVSAQISLRRFNSVIHKTYLRRPISTTTPVHRAGESINLCV
jgi:hypothetical protein